MATSVRSVRKKELCSFCSPKQIEGVTSCKGCLKSLCRKHFNEHRDVLSNDLNNVFDRHDELLQELQFKTDRGHKPKHNANAGAILKRIDQWEIETIEHVSEVANDARENVHRLFSRKRQLDQLKENVSYITKELKEQQESESFVETDIAQWIKRLEQLKSELHRPSIFETNPPVFEMQNIDWNTVIKICPPLQINQTSTLRQRGPMNTDSHIQKCANPRCLGFFYVGDDHRIGSTECPHCQFEQCQQCYRKWYHEHADMDCEEYAQWLAENDPNDPEVQLMKYLNTVSTIVCPTQSCKAVYEYKAGGSEHFTCFRCRTIFCRICSALFHYPQDKQICPRPNCYLRNALHSHCSFNCYRELRDADLEEIIQLLTVDKINFIKELRQKPRAIGPQCPIEGCKRAAAVLSENRFCEICYKEFLCSLIWQNELEPWELYTDNNLRQKVANAAIRIPGNATRENLITLARQHLAQFLGKPKKLTRPPLKH